MKIFPIGSSRLHEPLSHLPAERVVFPRMGYFHSSSQVMDVLRFIGAPRSMSRDLARCFFRKDQTPENPFDTGLWADSPDDSLARIRQLFGDADTLLIEISSPRSYRLADVHIQGNPNFQRSVSYDEVWKEGYYAKYAPDWPVAVYDDTPSVHTNLATIGDFLGRTGRQAIVMGHLVDPHNPNRQRQQNNQTLREAVQVLRHPRLRYHDASHLVAQHGFRIRDDGTVDIHHLPNAALKALAQEWLALIEN
jgi:hypothetical protein